MAAKRRRRICRLLAPKTAGLFGGFSAAGGDGKRPGILVKQTAVAAAAGAVEGVAVVVIAVAVGMMAVVLQAVAVSGGVGSSGGCRAFAEQCCNLVQDGQQINCLPLFLRL